MHYTKRCLAYTLIDKNGAPPQHHKLHGVKWSHSGTSTSPKQSHQDLNMRSLTAGLLYQTALVLVRWTYWQLSVD